jgi:hypothetical protein
MTTVPTEISGVVDHQVKLVLQTADNHEIQTGKLVDFIATRQVKKIEAQVAVVKQCSASGTFDNECHILSGTVGAIHTNLPDSPPASGTDTFQYNFANGWKLHELSKASHIQRLQL